MTASKIALYQTEQIRSCERRAIESGVSEDEMMARAGLAAFSAMAKLYPEVRQIAVFCGSGNNAGDGYVLARLAQEKGYTVVVNQYKSLETLPAAARFAASQAIGAGVSCQGIDEILDNEVELIIDALLGTGLQGDVNGSLATAINQMNQSKLPIISLDIPSGLHADTGRVMGVAVIAAATVTFIGLKIGMLTLDGPDHCGKILCDDLKITSCLAKSKPAAYLLSKNSLPRLAPRLKNSHKGDFGHVLVIGGGIGMPGAVYLAAKAALRVGAGMVTVATRPDYATGALPLLPEALLYGIEEVADLQPLIAKATVCIIGPGLGEDEWAQALFNKVIISQLPTIIDASALRLLAKNPQHDDNWILTPHPGEAASLLECTVKDIQRDRYQAALSIQQNYGGNIVLKGVGSLVCTDDGNSYVCSAGNPGMATAGMGDVLSGVIGGLLAQGTTLALAAKLGVWVHASAADLAARAFGERGLLASDLMPYLQRNVNKPFVQTD